MGGGAETGGIEGHSPREQQVRLLRCTDLRACEDIESLGVLYRFFVGSIKESRSAGNQFGRTKSGRSSGIRKPYRLGIEVGVLAQRGKAEVNIRSLAH